MESYAITIAVLVVAVMLALLIIKIATAKRNVNQLTATGGELDLSDPFKEPVIRFEKLDALTKTEMRSLVEIKDKKLLARIDNVIPGTVQTIVDSVAIGKYRQAVKDAGQLYQVIIPSGGSLTPSSKIPGGFITPIKAPDGTFIDQGVLKPVDGNIGGGLAAMTAVNAAMAVGSIIVGQYYMSQINSQLKEIRGELNKIAAFQEKEFVSKIYALFAAVQKYTRFQIEIVENKELRKRNLDHLEQLEHECAQLLAQANLTLKEYKEKKGLDYADYENLVFEAQTWYQYQEGLLKILQKIEELIYALNLGKVSKDNCYSLFSSLNEQVNDTLKALEEWHTETCKSLKIDLNRGWRLRRGVKKFVMSVPAFFNKNLRYKGISRETVLMISNQCSRQQDVKINSEPDLFQKEVHLVIKNGKLFYLPEMKTVGGSQESKSLQGADQRIKLGETLTYIGPYEPTGDRFFVTLEDVSDSDIKNDE